jgi:chromatin segregation and condensation protein Rec8/ScpA/Scc1 (kleisin family)
MAATLIHWKSQSLLPVEPDAESSDPIPEELVQQLLVHKRELADDLARRRALVEASFTRFSEVPPPESQVQTLTAWDLIQQARELAGWILRYREELQTDSGVFDVEPEGVLVADMIAYLEDQLSDSKGQLDGLKLLREQPSAARRASLFLAMLEMARDRRLDIIQESNFAPISLIPARLSTTHQVNH